MPLSCDGETSTKREAAGGSSHPSPALVLGSAIAAALERGSKECCPNSSGWDSWWPWEGHPSGFLLWAQVCKVSMLISGKGLTGSPGRIRATETLGLDTSHFVTEDTLLNKINGLKSMLSYQAVWE